MSFRTIQVALFTLVFAVLAHAQSPNPSKVAFIDSSTFLDEKGITKLVTANKLLMEEIRPVQNELNAISARLQTLSKEIENLRKLPVVDPKAIEAKIEEGEKLERELKFKSDDAKAKYERREKQVIGPMMQSIFNGLQEYAKLKAYTLIFDIAKDQNGLLIAIGDQSADVTKDFIAYYNAKP